MSNPPTTASPPIAIVLRHQYLRIDTVVSQWRYCSIAVEILAQSNSDRTARNNMIGSIAGEHYLLTEEQTALLKEMRAGK